MTLNLERGDLLQLEPISNRGTMRLLPVGKKNKQKLVIGDDSGQLSCYEFKKGEPQVVFQVQPFDGPVTCVALGGASPKKDKIFLSHSQRIIGYTKKGKDFFKLTSSLTETIQNIAVEDTRIWTGCEYIYNLYDNGKDTAFFISRDKINDLIVAHVTRDTDFDAVLACQDNCIRIIHGSMLFLEIPTPNAVTAVAFMEIEREIKVAKSPTALFFATELGALGLVQVFPSGQFHHIWSIDDGDKRSPITCITLFDINKDGNVEIIVGRDDGRLEVYKQETPLSIPVRIFMKELGESIRSLECGYVNSSDYYEIVLALYSGKVISFTTEPVLNREKDDNYGRTIQTIQNENRIRFMRKEVEELQKKLEKEREKAKKARIDLTKSSQLKQAEDFPVNSKFLMVPDLAAYVLTIELQTPIDLIILRCPVVLDLVETDTGTSVLSVTPPHLQPTGAGGSAEEAQLGKFVAVFRCQSQEKRIALTLRTNEGEFGDLTITVVAASNPKAAKIMKYNLKPLSLHNKVHELSEEEMARPRHYVKYSGNVQMSTINEWVQALFPDIPPRLDEHVNSQKYLFRNIFTGAVTTCEFKKDEIIFESESASTIAISKENITRMANYRRTTLEESVRASEEAVPSFLELLREKLGHQQSLVRKIQLVDAVQEIAMQEPSTEWLSDEYAYILNNQETIRNEFKSRDKSVEYLSGIITDLFVDWNRLQGVDAKSRIGLLQSAITLGTYDDVLALFTEKQQR